MKTVTVLCEDEAEITYNGELDFYMQNDTLYLVDSGANRTIAMFAPSRWRRIVSDEIEVAERCVPGLPDLDKPHPFTTSSSRCVVTEAQVERWIRIEGAARDVVGWWEAGKLDPNMSVSLGDLREALKP